VVVHVKILKPFISVSGMTLLSKLTGFAKLAMIAAFFGGGSHADVLLIVLMLPDLAVKLLSEGLIYSAAVPLFVSLKDDSESLKKAFVTLAHTTAFFTLILAALLAIFSDNILGLMTPSFTSEMLAKASLMWRILTVYVFCVFMLGVFASLLNSAGFFAGPAFAPVIVNLSVILAMLVNKSSLTAERVALITSIGGVLELAWLLFLIKKNRVFNSFSFSDIFQFDKVVCKRFLISSSSVGVWSLTLPIMPIYERTLASMAGTGGIAALEYSAKLFNFPLALFSMSLAQVLLPAFSSLDSDKRMNLSKKLMKIIFLLLLPAITVCYFGAEGIMSLVYKRGAFTNENAAYAGELFSVYSLALLPASLIAVLNRQYFASGKYAIPSAAALMSAALQLAFGRFLVSKLGISGIGWSAFGALSVQFLILAFGLFTLKESGQSSKTKDVGI